ncbi:hypothetical protein MDMS009_2020 [Methylophaga thiooxydans DMS010]|uniref:Uncharacterized protein n=1 Tax=Methylophaga thiooxydans DMS010 TaxID=637616 RepID=C0N7G4_9GAMM|nr:hypothetical protein MDMS009_2020 [Methylophaga thiooxydans DMS010]
MKNSQGATIEHADADHLYHFITLYALPELTFIAADQYAD